MVAREAAGGAWRPLLWPDHGEYVNTTQFLTDADALAHLRIEQLDRPVDSVCLFSDGLERLVLDFRARAAHAPFFDAVFQRFGSEPAIGHASHVSDELGDLLASDTVNRRTDDDKSILCATLLGLDHGASRSQEG